MALRNKRGAALSAASRRQGSIRSRNSLPGPGGLVRCAAGLADHSERRTHPPRTVDCAEQSRPSSAFGSEPLINHLFFRWQGLSIATAGRIRLTLPQRRSHERHAASEGSRSVALYSREWRRSREGHSHDHSYREARAVYRRFCCISFVQWAHNTDAGDNYNGHASDDNGRDGISSRTNNPTCGNGVPKRCSYNTVRQCHMAILDTGRRDRIEQRLRDRVERRHHNNYSERLHREWASHCRRSAAEHSNQCTDHMCRNHIPWDLYGVDGSSGDWEWMLKCLQYRSRSNRLSGARDFRPKSDQRKQCNGQQLHCIAQRLR